MPLEILPDLFDDDTHAKLDGAVNEAVKGGITEEPADLDTDALDRKYTNLSQTITLIKTDQELRGMLASAWKDKSYREIRNLAILRASRPETEQLANKLLAEFPPYDLHTMLSRSFNATYHGAAVDGFYEYLTHNEKLFKSTTDPWYYAKFCSIVQSSGTGKSRLLTELCKKNVVVIYMCLREEGDEQSFPPRDPIPSHVLTRLPLIEGSYETVCCAFFIALFDTLHEYLTTIDATQSEEALMKWMRQMCDMSHPPRTATRAEFFKRVFEAYVKVLASLKLSNSGERKFNVSVTPGSGLVSRLLDAYTKMGRSLENILPEIMSVEGTSAVNSDRPKLVIAFDEAHTLSSMEMKYRPADVLCRVINQYSHHRNHAVWVVFASTTSKVPDFSPPNERYNSDRVAILGEKLFPPYTQLGWDQSALRIQDIDVENVAQLYHIAAYGRPLWLSLRTALTVPQLVLDTASSKLCGGYKFDPNRTNHVLAVLGQRFGLDVGFGHPDSMEHLEKGVAGHLRICLATTLDRKWRFTSYPSEPLLSCVVARDIHRNRATLEPALRTLLKLVNCGMIDVGQRGELASRLLWLLAKDLHIREEKKDAATSLPSRWDDHLVDCDMISVVAWLEFVFGRRIWEENTQARKVFEDAYLNFSHWVCMESNIAGSKEGGELPLDEWTLRHWHRTSGVQCCHQQPLIDKVIPIYFKGGTRDASAKSRMSQILISDKARRSEHSRDVLRDITQRHKNISGEDTGSGSDCDLLPYIAILADLGQPPSFSVTFPEGDVRDRCLRIYAAGVDNMTYPFLSEYPALACALRDLMRIQQIPETQMPYREYLNAQVKFGSAASVQHMHWEHGRLVPRCVGNPGSLAVECSYHNTV